MSRLAGSERTRILVANEPRSYREVLGAAVVGLRPNVDVTVAEPDQLDAQIMSLAPQLVVASRAPAGDLRQVYRLVVLYPGGRRGATIDVAGVPSSVADLELDALIALIDASGCPDTTDDGAAGPPA
jgi:hypothetical protein